MTTANDTWWYGPSPTAPVVRSVTPDEAPAGSGPASVTIAGSNFVDPVTVTVGGLAATSATVVSETRITCTFPDDTAGFKDVTVTNAGGLSGTSGGAFARTQGSGSAATGLAFLVSPAGGTIGSPLRPVVEVVVTDALGNVAPVTTAITVALGTNASGANLGGTLTVTTLAGRSTFPDLTLDAAGSGFTLTATSAGGLAVTSAPFDVAPRPGSQLVITQQPVDAVSLATMSAVKVAVEDTAGDVLTGATTVVRIALGANPGGATLRGTLSRQVTNGIVTFDDLTLDKVGSGYTLVVSAASYTGPTSSPFSVFSGPAATLVIATQPPASTQAGIALAPAPGIIIEDAAGNVVDNATETVAVALGANPGGATLSGTLSIVTATGTASFSDLSLDRPASGYTLVFSCGSLPVVTSSGFAIVPGPAARLAFLNAPLTTAPMYAMATTLQVAVEDKFGSITTSGQPTVTIALGTTPTGAKLLGVLAVAPVNGIATFPGLIVDREGTGFTLAASASGLAGATSAPFDVTASPPDVVSISVPAGTLTGDVPITYALRQAAGARVDVLVEYDPTGTGTFHRATEAASALGAADGTKGITTSSAAAGQTHVFLWGSTWDMPGARSTSVQLRITASFRKVAGTPKLLSNLTVDDTGKRAPVELSAAHAVGGGAESAPVFADLNGDGKPDLALPSFFGTLVYWGDGAGGFSGSATFAGSSRIAAVDMDLDGNTDLVTASSGLTVWYGAGSQVLGGLTNVSGFASASIQGNCVVGDVNGDGLPDVVFSAYDSTTQVYRLAEFLNAGSRTFTFVAGPVLSGPAWALVDLDGDGKLDLVGSTLLPATLVVYRGKGHGTFATGVSYPLPQTFAVLDLEVADLDGDGRPDVVLASADDRVRVLLNKGQGVLGPATAYLAGTNVVGVAVGDVNGDGVPDIVASDQAGNRADILTGTGSGSFALTQMLPGYVLPQAVGLGDLTSTGRLDLVVIPELTNLSLDVLLYHNTGSGFDQPRTTSAGPQGNTVVVTTDLDRNGKTDLVTADPAGTLRVFLGDGSGSYGAGTDVAGVTSPVAVAVGDMNGDGKADLVVTSNAGTPSVLVAAGDGAGGFAAPMATPVGSSLGALALGDLDGNGALDVVVSDASGVQVLLGNGAGGFAAPVLVPCGRPGGLALADVTGDGKLDLVVTVGASVSVYPGNGAGGFGAPLTKALGQGLGGLVVSDVNADGTPDLVVASGRSVLVLLGTGGGSFGNPTSIAAPSPVTALAVADVNGDGLPDVLFGGEVGFPTGGPNDPSLDCARMSLVLGRGAGAFGAPIPYHVGPGPYAIAAGDVDGDGRADVVVVNGIQGIVQVLVTGASAAAESGVGTGPPVAIQILSQPANATAGEPLLVTAALLDVHGNVVSSPSTPVTFHLEWFQGGSVVAAPVSGTAVRTDVGGIVTFDDIVCTLSGGEFLPVLTSPGLASGSGYQFEIQPNVARGLAFANAPGKVVARATAPAVSVTLVDAWGNPTEASEVPVTLALGSKPGGATLTGTLTVDSSAGEATFYDLSLDQRGSGYTLVASAGSFSSVTSAPFDVTYQLAFTQQPASVLAGSTLPSVQVTIEDGLKNTVTSANDAVTVALGSNPAGATLSGTLTVTANQGVASFTDLSVSQSGAGEKLTAQASGDASATSASFDALASAAPHLVFTSQPQDGGAPGPVSPFRVAVVDGQGNVVTSSQAQITVALPPGTTGGGVFGPLGGYTTVNAVNGVATFDQVYVRVSGTWPLTVTSPGLIPATSAPFHVTPSTATSATFSSITSAVAGATFRVTVSAFDNFDNLATTTAGTLSLGLTQNGVSAPIQGTLTASLSNGVATFSGLEVDRAGTYTLAVGSGMPGVSAQTTLTVAGGAPVSLAFLNQPLDTVVGATPSPPVRVAALDRFGNVTGSATPDVALALAPAGVLGGTTSEPTNAGVAVFRAISVGTPGTFQLIASSGGLGTATSASFRVSSAPDVTALQVPAGTLGGAVPITYTLTQSAASRADVTVEVDASGSGTFRRATQAGSAHGGAYEGVVGVTTSPAGQTHTFLWNSTADVSSSTTVRLRVTARSHGASGASQTLTGLAVSNTLTFGTPTSVSAGQNPAAVALADLDGDGKPDLVVANAGDGTVSVLFGDGAGGFGTARTLAVGSTPVAIAVADLDHDGKPDLAVVNQGSGTVSILRNLGSGSFAAASVVSVGSGPAAIAVGDLNGDGRLDLVVANESASTVSILLGDGTGAFPTTSTLTTGSGPSSVALGDLDRNGTLDMVVAESGANEVAVFLGAGDGTFGSAATFATGTAPSALALADLDGNGTLDIAVANNRSGDVTVLLGDGKGSVASTASYGVGAGPTAILARDLDGDGKLDLAVACSGASAVAILAGSGGGALTGPGLVSVGAAPASLALGDLDRNGASDLVVAGGGSVSVALGTKRARVGPVLGAPLAVPSVFGRSTSFQVVVADLDGDGKPDLAVVDSSGIGVFFGNGDGTYGKGPTVSVGAPIISIAAGDLDGDGVPDLVVATQTPAQVTVLLGTGNGTFATKTSFSGGGSLALGDMNGDGVLDLVVSPVRVGSLHGTKILPGNGDGTFGAAVPSTDGFGPVALADVDQDGFLDVITDGPLVQFGDGVGGFASRTWQGLGGTSVAVGDVNGDGIPDLAGCVDLGVSKAAVVVYTGTGGGAFEGPSSYPVTGPLYGAIATLAVADANGDGLADVVYGSNMSWEPLVVLPGTPTGLGPAVRLPFAVPTSATFADLDGDGRPDLVVAVAGPYGTPGTVSVLPGASFPASAQTLVPAGDAPVALALGDLDRDGHPDLVAADQNTNALSLLRGDGSGGFGAATTLAAEGTPSGVALADLDGDGKLDAVVAALQSNTVLVLRGDGAGGFGAPTTLDCPGGPVAVAVADLDHDGKLDLVVVNRVAGTLAVFRGASGGTFGAAKTYATGGVAPGSIALADLNGDGNLDAIVGNEASSTVSVLLGDGSGGFGSATTYAAGSGPVGVGVGDLDRDGHLDVVAAGSDGTVSVLRGDGRGALGAAATFGGGDYGRSLALADMDGDGALDVVLVSPVSGHAAVFKGDGSGGLGTPTFFALGGSAYAVGIADVNGDGRLDVVATLEDIDAGSTHVAAGRSVVLFGR